VLNIEHKKEKIQKSLLLKVVGNEKESGLGGGK
jgi:hypothetical protein